MERMKVVDLLVVHQNALFRDGIRYQLAHTPSIQVLNAIHPDDMTTVCHTAVPSVVIVDSAIALPTQLELVILLHSLYPRAALLLLGAIPYTDYVRAVLHAGIQGWLTEFDNHTELAATIGLLATGKIVFDAALDLLPNNFADQSPVDPQQLSRREQEVLQLVQRGWSNKQIADCLGLVPKTIESHITRIFRKRGIRTRGDLSA